METKKNCQGFDSKQSTSIPRRQQLDKLQYKKKSSKIKKSSCNLFSFHFNEIVGSSQRTTRQSRQVIKSVTHSELLFVTRINCDSSLILCHKLSESMNPTWSSHWQLRRLIKPKSSLHILLFPKSNNVVDVSVDGSSRKAVFAQDNETIVAVK